MAESLLARAPQDTIVWFDFGGVLSPPLADLFDTYERKTGIGREDLWAAVTAVANEMDVPTLAPVELALISEAEWGARMRAFLTINRPGLDLSLARLETFGEQWFADIAAHPETVELVRRCRSAGYRVGVLSNNVVEWEPHWRRIIAPAGPFDFIVDSCRVGARKPQPEIFTAAQLVAGLPGEASVLIDDLAENCDAARRRGWTAVHFVEDGQARRDLGILLGLDAQEVLR